MTEKNNILLDPDSSILENNLLLEDLKNEELDSLISTLKEQQVTGSSDDPPWKLVKPTPGFVVKTRTGDGEKVFLNICHTEDIPSPEDISDAQLLKITESDEPSSFRLPMSIGELHEEPDKSGSPCSVCDIAINSAFFHKVENSILWRSFLLNVALEGVADKYNKDMTSTSDNYIILKNRKTMGSLQYHRIKQRGSGPKKMLIEEVKSGTSITEKPRFRIIRKPSLGNPELLTVQIHVKDASSGKKLLLDVGEDRLLLRSVSKAASLLDIFLPYSIDQDQTCAHFDVDTQILSVDLPVISVGK